MSNVRMTMTLSPILMTMFPLTSAPISKRTLHNAQRAARWSSLPLAWTQQSLIDSGSHPIRRNGYRLVGVIPHLQLPRVHLSILPTLGNKLMKR